MKNVELLAPAGNMDRLKVALRFGADAVYAGGKKYSLRAAADNFDLPHLKEGIELCHAAGKKMYVAANVFARNDDFSDLPDYFKALEDIGADGVIISDPGVFSVCRKAAPSLPVHISTQANNINFETVRFWRDLGAKRAVLARELSIDEIAKIHEEVPDIELEAFVHGAMCISYSGRCYLSDCLASRSSNGGECAQPCRWRYQMRKEGSDGAWMDVEEDSRGAYILNSKDLNMSAYLEGLAAAGVSAFKIEGRMKSEYYVAATVNAYRQCMDEGYSDEIEKKLADTPHRDYATAYALGRNPDTVSLDDTQSKGDCDYIGLVRGSEQGFIFVEMRSRFRAGEVLEVMSPDENFGRSFTFDKAYLPGGEETDDCKRVQEVYKVPCPYPLLEGDILRRRR